MVILNINTENDKNEIHKLDTFIDSKSVFILIYKEDCGPCNQVRPEWKKIENVLKKYSKNNDVAIVDINQELLKHVKKLKYKPMGFPTILYITNHGKKIEEYDNFQSEYEKRTIDSFNQWIKSKEKQKGGKWSLKYRRSINCMKPKGFSQKQYCKYTRKKRHRNKFNR